MVYGFKNREAMSITEHLRRIIVKLEKLVGLGLDVGQSVEFGGKENDLIHMTIHKYNH